MQNDVPNEDSENFMSVGDLCLAFETRLIKLKEPGLIPIFV